MDSHVNNSQFSLLNSNTLSRNGYGLLTPLRHLVTLWSRAGYVHLAQCGHRLNVR